MNVKDKIEKLKKDLNQHNINYYVHDNPTISDSEYDSLLLQLEKLESEFPELETEDSPTKRVGGIALSEFNAIEHNVPMLSLDKAFTLDELEAFNKRISKILLLEEDIEYTAEPKLDGLAVELVYKNGKFAYGSTRGDGIVGEDVSENLKTIKAIPLSLNDSNPPQLLEIRGEVFINKDDFEKLNQKRLSEGNSLFANARNCAAGSLRQLDSKITSQRPLRIYCYSPGKIEGLNVQNQKDFLDLLPKWGFPVNKNVKIGKGYAFLEKYYKEITQLRNSLNYDIDGVVFKVNSYPYQEKIGIRSKSPRWAIAGKFQSEQSTTIIEDIILSVGRTGAITPVAKLTPVNIGGVVISNATLHNQDEISRKDIRIGDTALVQRAGDVIPEVVKIIKEKRIKTSKPFYISDKCPLCNEFILKIKDDATFRCINNVCPGIIRGKIEYYVSKDCLDIDGMGIKIIDLLLRENIISDIADLYYMKKSDLSSLERMGEKSAQNLINAVEKSKQTTFSRFINGLGIRNVGFSSAKLLERVFHANLEKLKTASKEELIEIPEIGEIMAQSIVEFFKNSENLNIIDRCLAAGLVFKKVSEVKASIISGKTFVFTGSLEINRSEAKKIVESFGAKTSGSVSKNTDFVVAGPGAGSKLVKAKELEVEILNELEFQDLINKL